MADSASVTSNIVNGSNSTTNIVQGTAVTSSVTTGAQGNPGPGVPAGGLPGQVLAKASAADYDDVWEDPPQLTPTSLNLIDTNGVSWTFSVTTNGELVTNSINATNTFGNVFGVLTLG